MAVLLDLLSPYPILENLVSSFNIGDLFNLSRVNSEYRLALHGFVKPHFDDYEKVGYIRSALRIGHHRTVFWENLKSRSQLRCSEPHHVRGSIPDGCLICSAPVCEACIIKASFAKRNENTFQKRHRPLCTRCWYSGNQHRKHRISAKTIATSQKSYPEQAAGGEFCTCTAKNGHLCLNCKVEQNAGFSIGLEKCYGRNCPNESSESDVIMMQGRVCLWCSHQLPGTRSRAESRRDYDARYLLARSVSGFDRRSEEEEGLESFEEQRMLENDAISHRREEVRSVHRVASRATVKRLTEVDKDVREDGGLQSSEALHHNEWPLPFAGSRRLADLPRYEDQRTAFQNTRDR